MQIKGLSAKQHEIMRFVGSDDMALICDGSVRSGKTTIMSMAFLMWAMGNFNRTNFAICGKTVQAAERNILKPLMEIDGLSAAFAMSYKVSTRILTVRCGDTVNWFYLFGGKDESSYMLIQGITVAGVLFDEVALMPRSFVEQALSRAISYEKPKYFFSCNPESPQHWFYKEWLETPRENTQHIHFLLEDNPILTREMIERTKAMYSDVFYDRYILGLWVVAEGLVYKDFAAHTEKYLIDDALDWSKKEKKSFAQIMMGVDFGGTKSATKFQAVGITPRYEVVALEEEYIKNEEIDPDALNRRFADFVKFINSKYGKGQTRADSAETVLIRGLAHTAQAQNLGTQVKLAMKMPIVDRIRLVVLLMKQGRFLVSRNCPHLIEALQTAVYDSKKFEDERLDNGTSDIDSLDALEYCLEPWYKQLEAAGHIGR